MGSILKITKANKSVVWLPDPKRGGLSVTINDLDADGTGRNQAGLLFRDRIATKIKVTYSAPPLTNSEMSNALNAITDQFFTLEYPDPQTGTRKSITAYCGDRTAPVYSCINGNYMWEGLTVNFIER